MNEKKGIDKQLDEARKKAIELIDKVQNEVSKDLVALGDELVDLLGGCDGGPRRRH